MPDVFMVLTDDFDKFSGMGVMLNLDNMMFNDSGFNRNDYFKTTLETGKYNGKQYALPYETVPELMFINKTLLEREGIIIPDNNWTWEDMYRICSLVTKDTNDDGILDQFGTYNYTWTQAVYSNGVSLFNDSGTQAYFTDEKVIEGIKFAKRIYALNQGIKVSKDDFDNGNVAFTPLLFSDYRTYKTYPYKIKKYNQFKWDCITLPAGPDGGNTSIINTLLMGISSTTEYKKLAWEFLKTLTYDPEIQMDIFRYSQGISVLKEVTKSQEAEEILQKDMEKSEKTIDNDLLCSVITKGTIEPKFQKYKEALTLADNEITKMIEGNTNIDSTMKIFQRNINSYLTR
jgi:multiple sugar transport system substrate-binding protein